MRNARWPPPRSFGWPKFAPAQNRPADAAVLYQRVLTEFPNHDPLAKLSQERLAALGAALPPAAGPAAAAPTQEEADELARMREVAKNSPDLLNSAQDELPLNRAATHGWLEVARFLLDHGARVEGIPRVQPPLYTAAVAGRKAIVELFLDRGAPLEKSPTDVSPLIAACANGHAEVARVLLDRGADANVATARGYTPLHAATTADRVDLVQLLLEHGANPNVECRIATGANLPAAEQAGTPLELAAGGGSEPIVKILLAHHADPNFSPVDGYNLSLALAVHKDKPQIVEELIAAGAKLEVPAGSSYISPLYEAAGHPWHPELVRLLLDRGASPKSRNYMGQTAMQYSLNSGAIAGRCAARSGDSNRLVKGHWLRSVGLLLTMGFIVLVTMSVGAIVLLLTPLTFTAAGAVTWRRCACCWCRT